MSSRIIILPLLNKSVTTFRGPVCYLGDSVSLRTISDDIYGSLHRDEASKYGSIINPTTKCAYIQVNELETNNWSSYTRNQVRKIQTLLNILSAGNPALLGPAAIVRQSRKTKVIQTVDVEAVANIEELKTKKYRLRPSITRELLAGTYKIIDDVCNRHKKVFITLDKFNSSVTRATWEDKIIDTTISLESLIQARTELRFKFSLFLSFLVKHRPEEREQAFRLFLGLYDARSSLVHGSLGRKEQQQIDELVNSWETVFPMVRNAINYHLFFLHYYPNASWDEHLKRLVFGIDKRIID